MQTQSMRNKEAGFTLIELLTVIGIIGVLSALSLQGYILYKANAAYAVAQTTVRNAQSAVAAADSDTLSTLPNISLTTQSGSPGPITDADGRRMLPGMQLPRSVTLRYQYDPSCLDPGCTQALVQANHCAGKKAYRWIRFGGSDGGEVTLPVDSAGCAP